MPVVVLPVKVKPGADSVARFEAAINSNYLATPAEDLTAPIEYVLYEVYHSAEDFTAHQQTAHYLAFREAVADLMAEPRKGVHYTALLPEPWT